MLSGTQIFSCLNNASSLYPVAVKDGINMIGRTKMAYDEGGNHEARERLIEEVGTSVFWLCAIPLVKYVFDKYILDKNKAIQDALKEKGFECKPSEIDLRLLKKMQEYRGQKKSQVLELGEQVEKKLLKLSAFKIVAATVLPIVLLTTILPKFNQGLTKKIIVNGQDNNNPGYKGVNFSKQNAITFEAFINPDKKNKKDVSFKGLGSTLTSSFYNEISIAQKSHIGAMVALDVGISSGRLANSRNFIEGGEVAIREAGMLFFLFKAQEIIANQIEKLANKFLKVPIFLDPIAMKDIKNHLKANEATKNYADDWIKVLKDVVYNKNDKGVLELKSEEEICKYVKNNLQDIKNNPLLKISKKLEFIKLMDNGELNPVKLLETRKIKNLAEQMIEMIEKSKVESSFIDKAIRYKKTAIIGNILICSVSLGYLLPKLQYFFREKITGSKKFPGITGYEKEAQNFQSKKQQQVFEKVKVA